MINVTVERALRKRGLERLVALRALIPDNRRYSLMAIQPQGVVHVCKDCIGNKDHAAAETKFREFLRLARSRRADLAITPEYSCPWSLVEETVREGNLPEPGTLWVLGCESITPTELEELISRRNEIVWIHEDIDNPEGRFFDPICYIFHAQDSAGSTRPVCLVQFKGEPMSAHATPIEQENMIRGKERFVLRNDENSIHLTTLICSDALGFGENEWSSLPPSNFHPFLILHPQLNTLPRHSNFAMYRKVAYSRGGEDYEVICINWAKGFTFDGGASASPFGGSAFYTKSNKLDLTDQRVEENHRFGLYYTRYSVHLAHAYFFNYSEHVFSLMVTKTSMKDAPVVSRIRSGPAMEIAYTWSDGTGTWETTPEPNDGFQDLCIANFNRKKLSPLLDDLSALNKERLLELSTGAVAANAEWFKPRYLTNFEIGEEEIMKHTTVEQDPCPEAHRKRVEQLTKFYMLRNVIIHDPVNLPPTLKEFRGNCEIRYPGAVGEYCYNLWTKDGNSKATVAFVGALSSHESLRVFHRMYSIVPEDDRRRVVVWYQAGATIQQHYETDTKITHDAGADKRSISRES